MAANYPPNPPPPINHLKTESGHYCPYVPEIETPQGFSLNPPLPKTRSRNARRNFPPRNHHQVSWNNHGRKLDFENLTLADLLASSAPIGRPSILRRLLQGRGDFIGLRAHRQEAPNCRGRWDIGRAYNGPGNEIIQMQQGLPERNASSQTDLRSSSGFGSSLDGEETEDEDRPLIIDETNMEERQFTDIHGPENQVRTNNGGNESNNEYATFYYCDEAGFDGVEVQVMPLDLSIRR